MSMYGKYFKCANAECNWHGYDRDKKNTYDENENIVGNECPKCGSTFFVIPTNRELDEYGVNE